MLPQMSSLSDLFPRPHCYENDQNLLGFCAMCTFWMAVIGIIKHIFPSISFYHLLNPIEERITM